jgi:hypothetical protein
MVDRPPARCGTGSRVPCRQALDRPADLRESHEGPHRRWTRNDHRSRRAPRAAGNEPSVLAGRGRRAVRVLGAGSLAGRDADAPRGWNNVTAVDPTVSGVTLWSAAGHDVTCPGATLPVCHVWRPAGASGLLRRASPRPDRPATVPIAILLEDGVQTQEFKNSNSPVRTPSTTRSTTIRTPTISPERLHALCGSVHRQGCRLLAAGLPDRPSPGGSTRGSTRGLAAAGSR